MFDALLAHPGVVEALELRSTFGFMAFHGGSLEEMTDVIAAEAAARAGASYYGVLQPSELRWHVPSTEVLPEHSKNLAAFLDHVEIVVTVHGYGRSGLWATLLLGGRNRDLAHALGTALRTALPAYDVVTELDAIPPDLRGLHRRNPVNRPPQAGVQLELPPRVRGTTPLWADWEGPGLNPHTEALINALASVARREGPGTCDTTRGDPRAGGASRTHAAADVVDFGDGERHSRGGHRLRRPGDGRGVLG